MKQIILKQYREKLNRLVGRFDDMAIPKEGWLRTVRKAFNMSGAQLARRMGVTRASVSNAEKAELSGGVTLKKMEAMAQTMNCRFVYAIVPIENVEQAIKQRALKKATQRVKDTSVHMALEEQTLSAEQIQFECERIASELVEQMPTDFWEDEA